MSTHMNVWEWCWDYYISSPVRDPQWPSKSSFRVNRGGGCGSAAVDCRSSARNGTAPWSRHVDLGFRVAANLRSKDQGTADQIG